MKIERSDGLAMKSPPESTFMGDVQIGGYFKREAPSRLAGATVRFAPGARSPWKINPMGQTLVILSGKGLVQSDGQQVAQVRAGDIVWCAPGERHWEGVSPDAAMCYFAVQEEDGDAIVVFEKAVSDAEYSGAR